MDLLGSLRYVLFFLLLFLKGFSAADRHDNERHAIHGDDQPAINAAIWVELFSPARSAITIIRRDVILVLIIIIIIMDIEG